MVFGPVGDIVLGIFGRRSVGRDIGAVEGEIAGVARPHPVIDIAAIFPDRVGGGIDQPHILDLEPLDQRVLLAAIETRDEAAIARFLLAFGGDVLHPLVDRVIAFGRRKRVDPVAHPRGDIADFGGDIDARSGRGGQFVALRLREEAVLEIIVLGGGIVLHRTARAVMVRDHQPLGRNEARRTALQLDDRAHREAGQVGQLLGRNLEPHGAQIISDFG